MKPHFAWDEKYRPESIDACILPTNLKKMLKKFVEQGDIPNAIFVGSAGCGKTSAAIAMCAEIKADYIIINSSLEGDKDKLRTDITQFASSMSSTDGRKYVILDEADHLTWQVQPALRTFMEAYAGNCGFILTANYANRIIEPLHSRCPPISFAIPKAELGILCREVFSRLEFILKAEKVTYETGALVELILKHKPDWRRIINEVQRYAQTHGKVDKGILDETNSISIKEVVPFLKLKDFGKVRKWAAENVGNDPVSIFRTFYDETNAMFDTSFIPELIVGINEYQYKSTIVRDQEINLSAFLVWVMIEGKWK